MRRTRVSAAIALAAAILVGAAAGAPAAHRLSPLGPSFTAVETGAAGGTAWIGVIPGGGDGDHTIVYTPPGFSPAARYPVVYLLHGMPGDPWEYVNSLRLARVADELISAHEAVPFVAVAPAARGAGDGEWAGPYEDYLVARVVPWVDAHLPTDAGPGGRTLAGVSAGGYGALDIGLRHPLFGTLESWGGYFAPFADGPLRGAPASVLAAHAPAVLVRRQAAALRARGVRFFVSSGPSHGRVHEADTVAFARELARLGVPHRLLLVPRIRRHPSWRTQFRAGLRYALAPAAH
jgi:enterochelin esterase-like enzyme